MTRALTATALPAIALAMLFSAPAHAGDPRLVEHMYDPSEVVLIEGRTNVQATIAFGEDELIENVAIGNSADWQVTPNKRANLLFVKPLEPRAATNMTVVTNKHTYLFDLVAKPQAEALYVLRFTYPEEPEEETAVQMAQRASGLEMAAATDPYAVTDPTLINREWKGSGDEKLLPSDAYDDGEATFLSWDADKAIPAILIKNKEGIEGPVNFAVRGETVVIDGVPREIILRAGDEVALLVNQGPERQASGKRGNGAFAMTATDNGEAR